MIIEVIYTVNGTTCTDLIDVEDTGASITMTLDGTVIDPNGRAFLGREQQIKAAMYRNAERIIKYVEAT